MSTASGDPFELPLHEEILLLALRDEKGTTGHGSMYAYAMAGAILAELTLRERIDFEKTRRSTLVTVRARTQTGDPVLDEVLDRIRTARRRAAASTWVSRIAQTRGLKVRTAERLRQKGVLKVAEDRILLLFTRKVYPTIDPGPEQRIIERLRAAFLSDAPPPDPRTATLASLAAAASMLDPVLDAKERKARAARIKALKKGEAAGEATDAALRAVQSAVVAATTTVIIAASVASS